MESGIEAYFTSALIQEFQRSEVASIVAKDQAELMIVGDIMGIAIRPETPVSMSSISTTSPIGAVLVTQYRVISRVRYRAIRLDNESVIWEDVLENEKTYPAPQVTIPNLNSVNALYNLSARKINIEALAKTVSIEAHNRITENF